MSYESVIKKEPRLYLNPIKDDIKKRRDKNFFWPTGTQVYCGTQGQGKTISAVRHILALKKRYPRAIIVSNLNLNYFVPHRFKTKFQLQTILQKIDPDVEYIQFHDMEQLSLALVNVNNEHYGVIYLIDEIHTYFNALESKNIPMYVFTEISQQRKQRKLIIGTSQLFLRMAKPFREQCDNLIICKTRFNVLTIQKAYDGMSLNQDFDGSISGNMKKRGFFFQSRHLREAYDTYQKVVSGAEQYEQIVKAS